MYLGLTSGLLISELYHTIKKNVTAKQQGKDSTHTFFYKKIFYKKMSLKNPKTLRKC